MNNPDLIKSFTAETAIAAYRVVKFGSTDDYVVQAAAATDALMGVCGALEGGAGKRADVVLTGVAEVEYGGIVTRGDLLTSDANGKAVAVTRHTHTENTAAAYMQNAITVSGSTVRVIGVAMVSGVAGDIGSVNIIPSFA